MWVSNSINFVDFPDVIKTLGDAVYGYFRTRFIVAKDVYDVGELLLGHGSIDMTHDRFVSP